MSENTQGLQVGDRVRILSYEEIQMAGDRFAIGWNSEMVKSMGTETEVADVRRTNVSLRGNDYSWCYQWIVKIPTIEVNPWLD